MSGEELKDYPTEVLRTADELRKNGKSVGENTPLLRIQYPSLSIDDCDFLLRERSIQDNVALTARKLREKEQQQKNDEASLCEIIDTTIAVQQTDTRNSDLFAALHRDEICYCFDTGNWHIWNGERWLKDETGKIAEVAKETIKGLYPVVKEYPDEIRRNLLKHAVKSESGPKISEMLKLARSSLPALSRDLDSNPNFFNCKNGTLELDMLTFREFRREDMLSKMAGVEYIPGAECPKWEAHINIVLGENKEWIECLQQVLGVALLGTNPDQIFNIFWGSGNNGKTTMMLVLRHIMGEYGTTLSPDSLSKARYEKSGSDHRADRLCLKWARLVISEEAQQGRALDMSLMKSVTGGSTIKVRAPYSKDEEEFKPMGVICYAVNHRPVIQEQSNAAWRRVLLWKCTATIPREKRVEHYENILIQEGPGILNWLLEGLRKWREAGRRLIIPTSLIAVVDEYRKEENPLQEWMDEDIVPQEGAFTPFKDAYGSYYKKMRRDYPNDDELLRNLIGKKNFSNLLSDFYEPTSSGGGVKNVRGFKGFVLAGVITLKIDNVTGEVLHVGNSLTSMHKSNSSTSNSLSVTKPSMEQLLKEIGSKFGLDVSKYQPCKPGYIGKCIHKGCNHPVAWVDQFGFQPLCEYHYLIWR